MSSPSCRRTLSVTNDGQNPACIRTQPSNDTVQWLCPDLQSALVAAVGLSSSQDTIADNVEQQNVSTINCVSVFLPPGDHFITAPVHFGAANVSIYGTGTQSSDVSVFCEYTVDVDESRIFDRSYNYTDYTFYFDRSEVVSLERLQFIGCPYPLRLDTVATVDVYKSAFM